MKKRVISGAVYALILVGLFLLRSVSLIPFDIFVGFVSVVAVAEMYRAMKEQLSVANLVLMELVAVAMIPVLLAFGFSGALVLIVAYTIVNMVLPLFSTKITLAGTGYAAMIPIYPTLFIDSLSVINHFDESLALSTTALLFVFVVATFTDTFAFFVGSLLKGPKLCPTISPNKTVSGAIGGIVGGVLGALAVCIIAAQWLIESYRFDDGMYVVFFILLGIACAIATEFGDLVESHIKRKVGIKDMGNIMPGHGGAMDRFDGIMFVAIIVCICFQLVFAL